MKKKIVNSGNNLPRIKYERDPIPWRYCLLTLVCGVLLVGGFLWVARQHFSAIDYGIKNANLRQSKTNLEADQRRLFLTKEISLSPVEIKKTAQKFGLEDLRAGSIEMLRPKDESKNPDKKVIPEIIQKTSLDRLRIEPVATQQKSKIGDPKSATPKAPKPEIPNSPSALNRPRIAAK